MGKLTGQENMEPAMIDHSEGSGSIKWLLLLAFLLVGVAVALVVFKGEIGGQIQLVFLSVLAGLGILSLLGFAVGLIQLGNPAPAPHLTRQFVDSMNEGILVCDGKDRLVYANTEYARLTGAEDASAIRSIERSFAGEPDAAEAIYRLSEAVRSGRPALEEFRLFKAPSGGGDDEHETQARWFRIRVRKMQDIGVSGKVEDLFVWQVSDITRDRERQENIFQELQLAINYLDHAPAGFFSAEPDGRVIYMNATLADWLGYDLAQFEPRQLNLNELVPGDGTALLEAANSAPGMPKTEMIDLDLVKSNGQSLPVRLMHRVPMASDGTPGASRTLVLNRSPGEDISEELRVAEVRFARFFNNTPIAIAALTGDGRVLRTNAPFARMFKAEVPTEQGVQEGESEEKTPSILNLVAEKDQENLTAAIEMALQGQSNILPVECLLAEDKNRTVRFFLSGVEDSEGDDEQIIVYALETTEQRALEEQFSQSQKMQAVGQLAGGVAHDFNNVLTAIIGFSDLLLTSHRPSDPAFQDIMNIKQNANRAASLVRQLLAFSRRQTLRPQVLALGDVLADLSILLDRLLGEKVDLDLVHGRDLWPVKADLNQLEQVIVNLAVNARDAMPDGGHLTIQTRNMGKDEAEEMPYKQLETADYVLLEVVDSGTGIPADIRDKIFEPFFSTKDVGKGTGLGLSTVYGIIKQTGGFIFLESEMGQGTTFRIFLPRYVEEAKAITIDAAATDDPEQQALEVAADEAGKEVVSEAPPAVTDLTGNATILLVEDEEAVRAFAARALASRGYQVYEAGSGAEALELIHEIDEPIDLVVSDVVMPEMDGPTMLGELRKIRPELKVIFMSGYAEEAFRKNLPDNEEFGFLPKPFSLKQLATKIKEMLDDA
ncbi:two-component system, cell cycle sensor histidine kinase and response regulator CckA [Cohaesibacter marisflavi]|uniref:histidine kinase n=1 Tax=Cohaesibacter marisflavi TaxID=655353 RepID=A0A1I5J1L4_9HYPH|nr:response regulator [Cohaesibacter marisflavi]SFO66632.1 two-component system, cell cycle sensor histidine kinase and response regulator CckA [Cohaesibacter marisflavi]